MKRRGEAWPETPDTICLLERSCDMNTVSTVCGADTIESRATELGGGRGLMTFIFFWLPLFKLVYFCVGDLRSGLGE